MGNERIKDLKAFIEELQEKRKAWVSKNLADSHGLSVICFDRLESDNPVKFCIVHPYPKVRGGYQVTYFADELDPISHFIFESREAAVEALSAGGGTLRLEAPKQIFC